MSTTMTTFVLLAIMATSALAAVLAWLVKRNQSKVNPEQSESIGKIVVTSVSQEIGQLRSDSQDQARGLRQEVGDNIRGFQTSVLDSFTSLSRQQGDHMRSFGEEARNGFGRLEQRTSEIAQRVSDELQKISSASTETGNVLRAGIEGKLDQFGEKTDRAARELRTEVAGGIKNLHESVTLTLESRLKELSESANTNAQTTGTTINEGLSRVGVAVNTSLEQISAHQKERLETLQKSITALTENHNAAQEALRKTVEGRLDAIRTENLTKLDEMRKTVDEKLQSTLEARLGESFRLVSQQLENVHKGLGEMQSLAAGVGDLKKVMTNVKVRGTWGEVQLGNLLEQFLSPDQYVQNAQIKEDSGERVEFAIKLPGRNDDKEVLLPIDAKFPQEDFARLVAASESGDPSGVEAASAALETKITAYAKTIREKYIHAPTTTEFAVLFLPTEGLYAEVLRCPGLPEHLQTQHHVTIAGPTNLAAMLNAFQLGFRSLAIEKRSSEVWKILGAVRTEFQKHADVVNSLRKQLNSAVNTIDRLDTRTRVMNRTLRDVEALPDTSASALLQLEQATPQDEEVAEEHV